MTTDINELFSRDPLKLSDQDIDAIIEEMRKKRHMFNSAPSPKAASKSLTKGQEKASKLNIELDL